jgi:hypothetical protein
LVRSPSLFLSFLGVGCWALVVGRSILFAAYPFKVAKNLLGG